MNPKRCTKRRTSRIKLFFQFPGAEPLSVRVPLDVSPHDLVLAARGKFLPTGVLPSQLLRGDRQLAFYDPMLPLRAAGTQTGDLLFCELDMGQPLDSPSFLSSYRAMTDFAAIVREVGKRMGHLDPLAEVSGAI